MSIQDPIRRTTDLRDVDVTGATVAAGLAIVDESQSRLEGDLSERDWVAVEAALTSRLWPGSMSPGISLTSRSFLSTIRSPVRVALARTGVRVTIPVMRLPPAADSKARAPLTSPQGVAPPPRVLRQPRSPEIPMAVSLPPERLVALLADARQHGCTFRPDMA